MADNFLEREKEKYEKMKAAYIQKKREHINKIYHNIDRPIDESL